MNSIREVIIQDFLTRAAGITAPGGYNTNIGAKVLRARKKVDPSEVPAVVIFPGTETSEAKYGQNACKMTMRIEGIAKFGATDPSVVSEWILADLKKCFLAPENSLTSPATGWARTPDYIDSIVYTQGGSEDAPEDGQITIGAFAAFDVSYTTKVNDPYSQ